MIECVGNACTGCGACIDACPVKCISMKEGILGHTYPEVDEVSCIGCGVCQKVCHALAEPDRTLLPRKSYAVQAVDREVLMDSSSGGAFSVFADNVLRDGGVVYGSEWSKGEGAVHVRVESANQLSSLRRSKYVQSCTVGIFDQVRKDLDEGIKVLFCGVPCQVAALRVFLGDTYSELITIDLVCHGVPSSKLFEEYLSWLERDEGAKLERYDCRDKRHAGWSYLGAVTFSMGTVIKTRALSCADPYVVLFGQGSVFRESCYSCKYSGAERVGDITLCDFWGAESVGLDFDLDYGLSGVMVNTDRGEKLISNCFESMRYAEVSFNDIAKGNHNLRESSKRPVEYEKIAEKYSDGGFLALARFVSEEYRKVIAINKIKRSLPVPLKRFLKSKIG